MNVLRNFLSGKRIFEKEVGINTFIQKSPSEFPSFAEYLKCAELGDNGLHYIIKSLEKIREAGFCWVDYNSYGYHWVSRKNLEWLHKYTLSLGLKPFSIHSQGFKPEHLPFAYRKMCDLTIETAKILSVKCITYHPFPVVSDKKLNAQTVFDWNAEIVGYLGERARPADIKIAIENVSSFFPDAGSIISLIEYLGLPNLGVCLDTGHANLLNTIPEKEIERAGKYLIQTHLNDNYGKGGAKNMGLTQDLLEMTCTACLELETLVGTG